MEEDDDDSPSIRTTRWLAASRQIHGAIEHLMKGQYECAITLALAAEGQLPHTNSEMHLLNALQNEAPDLAANNAFNLQRNWLKHYNEYAPAEIELSELMAFASVMRAVSKFNAIYGELTAEMHAFGEWAREKKYMQF
jgi:hypothetical protein